MCSEIRNHKYSTLLKIAFLCKPLFHTIFISFWTLIILERINMTNQNCIIWVIKSGVLFEIYINNTVIKIYCCVIINLFWFKIFIFVISDSEYNLKNSSKTKYFEKRQRQRLYNDIWILTYYGLYLKCWYIPILTWRLQRSYITQTHSLSK